MEEQELKVFTQSLADVEKLHGEVKILKMKYVTMFAAVKSSFTAAKIPFELDETYLNELLEKLSDEDDFPFATQAEIEGEAAKGQGPTVVENTGEVATFSDGSTALRQRPQTWHKMLVRPGLHAGPAMSAVALGYDNFKSAFAVGNSLARVQQILLDPESLNTSDGIPSSKGRR
jgi:hypothetical protein